MHDLEFRRLATSDLPLLCKWFSEPHVEKWWHQGGSAEEIERKYTPRIQGSEPTHVFIIEYQQQPIGLIQWYRWHDYVEHASQLGASLSAAGIDIAIDETQLTGKGIGSHAILKFVKEIVFSNQEIDECTTDPELENVASLKAFARAGFVHGSLVQLKGESIPRQVVTIRRATATCQT